MNALTGKEIFKSDESPIFERLKYISPEKNQSYLVTDFNRKVRDIIYKQTMEEACWRPLADLLQPSGSDDILISETDRYGLPQRTVVSRATGLMRTDPFYTSDYLNTFYIRYYRDLYSSTEVASKETILREQVDRGSAYFSLLRKDLKRGASVLEIGCGMGGILIPFKLAGMNVTGIDLGPEFIELGNNLNLNLYVKSLDDLLTEPARYDLVILSHVIEHIPDLNEFLNKLKNILTETAKVFIAVPGVKYIHQTYGGNVHTYLQNAHCWSFTKTTLTAVLLKRGFEINYIDEQINCIAVVSSNKANDLSVAGEAHSVIAYLKDTEKRFQSKYSFFRKAYRSLTLRTEALLFGKP